MDAIFEEKTELLAKDVFESIAPVESLLPEELEGRGIETQCLAKYDPIDGVLLVKLRARETGHPGFVPALCNLPSADVKLELQETSAKALRRTILAHDDYSRLCRDILAFELKSRYF